MKQKGGNIAPRRFALRQGLRQSRIGCARGAVSGDAIVPRHFPMSRSWRGFPTKTKYRLQSATDHPRGVTAGHKYGREKRFRTKNSPPPKKLKKHGEVTTTTGMIRFGLLVVPNKRGNCTSASAHSHDLPRSLLNESRPPTPPLPSLTTGTRLSLVAMHAIHVRSRSSLPNSLAGRTMVASGNTSLTASSP